MTQPKPSSARDSAPEDNPPASPQSGQPLPFTPAKGAAPQLPGREPTPQAPSGQPSQPIQFTPARTPAPSPQAPPPAAQTPIVVKPKRRISRFVMLVVIPIAALALGFSWWLSSGRYVSTDNAYVGADKSLITPQVTGAIVAVHVVEGQKVKVGDPLFDIDPKPYEIALALAKGKLEAAKVEFANLQSTYVEQYRPDQNGRGRGEGPSGRLRPQERPRHFALRHGRRSRHLDGQPHSGQADPRIRQMAAGRR